MSWWRDLSIVKRLYFVVGLMAVLIIGELLTLRFAAHQLSAGRAFVAGEGYWSKAQKNAVFSLLRYTVTHDEKDYQDFLQDLKVTDGDHRARVELESPHPDLNVVRQGLLEGRNHPGDLDGMINLLKHYSWVSFVHQSVEFWRQADESLQKLKDVAANYHNALKSHAVNKHVTEDAVNRIQALNAELTQIEDSFSYTLGDASRWIEHLTVLALLITVLAVEGIGLTLTFVTARRISQGLSSLNNVATRIGQGDFSRKLAVQSRDEIGTLMESINKTGEMLESSYKDLERRVADRTRELNDALQARDEFLSIASHELKTPLTSLFLQLQLTSRMLRSPPSPETYGKIAEAMTQATKQGRKFSLLIDELLDLTRIRAGKLTLNREECDLGMLIQESLLPMISAGARRRGDIQIIIRDQVVGCFDPLRIGQVVTNLLSNAIKYGEGKPIELRLDKNDGVARLSVRDEGLGIAPEKQRIIFERFERAVGSMNVTGLGLGLYIARQIVEAHGGSISVDSTPGRGSLFTVTFPIQPA